jgi:hypothetical protein
LARGHGWFICAQISISPRRLAIGWTGKCFYPWNGFAMGVDLNTTNEKRLDRFMKKTKFLFDVPVIKDWLFIVFLFILATNVISGLSNVSASGGFSTTTGGLVSGLLDGAFRVLFSWFPIIPIIYAIRKQIRKRKPTQAN